MQGEAGEGEVQVQVVRADPVEEGEDQRTSIWESCGCTECATWKSGDWAYRCLFPIVILLSEAIYYLGIGSLAIVEVGIMSIEGLENNGTNETLTTSQAGHDSSIESWMIGLNVAELIIALFFGVVVLMISKGFVMCYECCRPTRKNRHCLHIFIRSADVVLNTAYLVIVGLTFSLELGFLGLTEGEEGRRVAKRAIVICNLVELFSSIAIAVVVSCIFRFVDNLLKNVKPVPVRNPDLEEGLLEDDGGEEDEYDEDEDDEEVEPQ